MYIKFVRTIALVALFGWATPAKAQDSRSRYKIPEIEAGYIYNFIDFVHWPESSQALSDTVVIGIIGDDEFGDAFAPVEGSRIGGKILSVRRSDRIGDLQESRIVYVASSEAPRLKQILETLKHRPVLTISDMDGFTEAGGMVQFYTTEIGGNLKVRFDINKDLANEAGLKISFRLLSLARPKK